MNLHELGTMRRPALGYIAPLETLVIQNTGIPIDTSKETVMVLASHRKYVLIRQIDPQEIVLENTGPVPIFYSVFIVPIDMVDAVRAPWRQLLKQIMRRLRKP
jgi:hypothetical protein